jgi:hypothetical protein
MNFNFPIADFSCSNKVIEILKKRIIKHGGKIFDIKESQSMHETYYYLVS